MFCLCLFSAYARAWEEKGKRESVCVLRVCIPCVRACVGRERVHTRAHEREKDTHTQKERDRKKIDAELRFAHAFKSGYSKRTSSIVREHILK